MTAKFNFKTLGSPIEADWPVKIPVPQDGGTVEIQELDVRFVLLTAEQIKALDAKDDAIKNALRAAITGFGKTEPTKFTPELLEQLLAMPFVLRALNLAYGEFSIGVAAKN